MRTSIVSTLALAAVAVARPFTHEDVHDFDTIIKRQGGCKDVTLIFCRGTWEPGGPVGLLVGTPFTNAVRSSLGMSKVEIKGVNYDAGVVGYLIGGDPAGATTMAKMVSEAVRKCPSTKIIMGGYSQGAQVAHLAAAKLSAEEKSKVAAVVVFGDPYKGKGIPGIPSDRIHTICASDDMICWGIPLPIGSHLTYGSDTKNIAAGAAFIKDKVGSAGSSAGKTGSGKAGGGKAGDGASEAKGKLGSGKAGAGKAGAGKGDASEAKGKLGSGKAGAGKGDASEAKGKLGSGKAGAGKGDASEAKGKLGSGKAGAGKGDASEAKGKLGSGKAGAGKAGAEKAGAEKAGAEKADAETAADDEEDSSEHEGKGAGKAGDGKEDSEHKGKMGAGKAADGKGGSGKLSKSNTPKSTGKGKGKAGAEMAGHEHAAKRMTEMDDLSEDERFEVVVPFGAEGNPALVGIVESLFEAAYARIGIRPDVAPVVVS